jgi:hypothetical protein
MQKALADEVRARFMASLKMTASRKRFLSGASEFGVWPRLMRGSTSFSAGGQTIGQTEMNILLSAGWIAKCERDYVVTEAGSAALECWPPRGDDNEPESSCGFRP